MNFELKTLSLASAAKSPSDALIVLISDQFQAAKDPLSLLIDKALKAKDFSSKTGKVLQTYAALGISAPNVTFLGVGAAKAIDLKSAMAGLT
ncbi:MAG: Cytosol aminopeptidase, partial [Pseudomonadota bacterium]